MKRISLVLLVLIGLVGCNQVDNPPAETLVLDSQDQRISYLLGMDNGKGIQSTGIELDVAAYKKGVEDSLSDVESQLSEAEAAEAI